ncbi:3-hydroxyacyl-CoA dehydrogenase NAD-binding domain-containing protein [Paenibacillus sp. IITD108]|uniref:3-hydroxyacyl-CoA dehydrogenase/enoyl-CoA hydratase family protein n=1 Tax=Paenibacillus sp. IITD108 TaxID=3116649 RepID=UPI003FA72663
MTEMINRLRSLPLQRAAVIGSGVMGAGIAAQLANAGFEVSLLDQAPNELTDQEKQQGKKLQDASVRNKLAAASLERLSKAKPAHLYDTDFIRRITPGNLADAGPALAEADWIIEAVVERLDIKKEVLGWIDKWRKEGALVSTNTSGLSVADMQEGRSEDFKKHFAAAHFFNPPRYMKLVELVPTSHTSKEALAALSAICTERLGKGVVIAKDTPNFIANRIGAHGMLVTLAATEQFKLTVEEADALTGPALGRPKSATYRMLDLIGLDTLLHVIDNVRERSGDEEERQLFTKPAVLEQLVAEGRLGEKSGAGFYRKQKDKNGKSKIEAVRWGTLNYEPSQSVQSPIIDAAKAAKGTAAKTKAILKTDSASPYAQFVWTILKATWLYSAKQVGIIADSIVDIDRAMKWGFNWELGPFELWDAVGLRQTAERMRQEGEQLPEWVEEWLAAGHESFYKQDEEKRFYVHSGQYVKEVQERDVISLAALKASGKTVLATAGASLIDIGDDVVCLEFHSANNAIGSDVLSAIRQAVPEVEQNWRGLVLANEGRNFCVGANLVLLLMEAQNGDWDEVEDIIRFFQSSMLRLKRMGRPLVAAPHRMTLGGGVEACLPADQIILSPETYFGLVETGVGLIPAGGGSKEAALLAAGRAEAARDALSGLNLQPHLNKVFETLAMGKASVSGHDAKKLGLLREQDRVIMRQDARIAEAKRAVLELDRCGYTPAREERFAVAGREGKAVLKLAVHSMLLSGAISEYDAHIGSKLAHVLAGGNVRSGTEVSEQYMLDLECEAFLSLCGERKTQERISHMLTFGKPLRN